MRLQLCAEIEGKQVWPTALTDVMENLLAKVHLLNQRSPTDNGKCNASY